MAVVQINVLKRPRDGVEGKDYRHEEIVGRIRLGDGLIGRIQRPGNSLGLVDHVHGSARAEQERESAAKEVGDQSHDVFILPLQQP
jgi:hypothetical protein